MDTNAESSYLLAEAGTLEDNRGETSHKEVDRFSGKSLWRDTTFLQKVTFIYAAAGTMTVFACQGVAQPFLSRVVVSKGGERFYAAAILDSTYLFAAIASLVCGKYQSKIPTKKFVWIGQLILAVTQGCLGFLKYLDNSYGFLVLGVLVKAIQGVGHGFFNVATLTLLWHEIPDHIGKSFGMIKVMTSTGYLVGPLISGYLYSIHNEMLIPFTVSATLPLMLSVVGWRILPNVTIDQKEDHYKTWSYICNPKSVIAVGLSAASGGVFAVFEASFTSYAQGIGIGVATVGLMFSMGELLTAVSNALYGYFSPLNHILRQFLIITTLAGMLGINFAFTANQSVSVLFGVTIIFAVFASVSQTLLFPEMIYRAVGENDDVTNDFSFRSKLSGVWYFVITLAMFAFGVAGTGLQNYVTFSISLTISMLVGFTLTFVVFGLIFIYRCKLQRAI